jgi:ribosome-associated protein
MEKGLLIQPGLLLPIAEVAFRFTRSGGPGGQHVNKVATRVEVHWNPLRSPVLTESQKEMLRVRLGSRLRGDGELRIVVDSSRSQWKNRELALLRLAEAVRDALRPARRRIATHPTQAARAETLRKKKLQGSKKRLRSSSRRFDQE